MRNTMVNMADTGGGGKSQTMMKRRMRRETITRGMDELQQANPGGSPIYAKPKKPSGGGSAPAPTQNRKGSPSTKPSVPRNPSTPGKGGFSGGSASEGRMRGV